MKPYPIYQEIALVLQAIENCKRAGNDTWLEKHEDRLHEFMQTAPSGSGIDSGTHLLRDECTPDKLTFSADFHHMDEHGYYDGWSTHRIIVRPSLAHTIDIRVTGRNRNDIKEYLHEVYSLWLTSKMED